MRLTRWYLCYQVGYEESCRCIREIVTYQIKIPVHTHHCSILGAVNKGTGKILRESRTLSRVLSMNCIV